MLKIKALYFFFGGLFAVLAVICIIYWIVKHKVRKIFGFGNLMTAVDQIDEESDKPKSLNGMDSIYLPQILKDFPDFNPVLAETYVRRRLEEELGRKADFFIHNIVISGYERYLVEKTVKYQASLQYNEGGTILQKRYCLHYSFVLNVDGGKSVAANCPNCKGAVSETNQSVCEYCGSRLVNVMGNTWKFTEVYEG